MATVKITTADPNGFLGSLPLLKPTIQAAVNYINKYVVFRGVVDVHVQVDTTSTGRFAGNGDVSFVGVKGGKNTWEPAGVAESRKGVDPNPGTPDFTIYIDPTSTYVSALWWDPKIASSIRANPPNNKTDAFTVIVHELLHGMGVVGWRNIETGALPGNVQSVWDSQVAIKGSRATFEGAAIKDLLGKGLEVRLGGSQGAFHLGNGPTVANSKMPWLEASNLNSYYYYDGERYLLGRLELAILKDLGWTLKSTTLTDVVDPWNNKPNAFYKVGWETSETLKGGALADRLEGRGGNDTLEGLGGNDTLYGGLGNDTIKGGAGSDEINGGAGRDVLTGGPGADDFNFSAASETGKTASTRDRITDFRRGTDDIDLRAVDANSTVGGNQSFKFIGTAAFHKAAGELRYVREDNSGTSKDRTIISGDVDGDGKADFQIELTGLKTLSSADFFL